MLWRGAADYAGNDAVGSIGYCFLIKIPYCNKDGVQFITNQDAKILDQMKEHQTFEKIETAEWKFEEINLKISWLALF